MKPQARTTALTVGPQANIELQRETEEQEMTTQRANGSSSLLLLSALLLLVGTGIRAGEDPRAERGFSPETAFQVGEIDTVRRDLRGVLR